MKFGFISAVLGLEIATGILVAVPGFVSAQEVNCANQFRSGKLYFDERVYRKAVDHFALSVKACPDKGEYRARYAMALGQLGEEKLKVVEATGDVAGNQADVDSVLQMYNLAGSEFDASLKTDASKKNVKFVGENRQHFWVARYNEGIKLSKEEKHGAASMEFDLARRINPAEIKAYRQGAVSLIKENKTAEATKLIDEGLAIAPNDTTLKRMKDALGASEAGDIIKQIENGSMASEQAGPLCSEADSLFTAKIAANPKDADTYFKRGLGRLTCAAVIASTDSAHSVAIYSKAAEDFQKARELVPASTDTSFYQNALYNEIQASMNAGDIGKSVDMIQEYMDFDCEDSGMWKSYAQALYLKGEQQKSLVALIISNAVSKDAVPPIDALDVPYPRGSEVPVLDAAKNAQEDAKKAQGERGDPTHVYAYTQVMGETTKQIQVWLWCNKKKANVYYLGKDNGEVDW